MTSALFEFRSSEAGSSFECSLDGGAFAACDSPHEFSGVSFAAHEFAVRATDAAGNTDPTPATRAWTAEDPDPPGGGPSDPPAADPGAAAPAVGQASTTSFAAATDFLFSGADPIQTGVAEDAIEAKRVAVLRGRVSTAWAARSPASRVSVLDHAELGRTATRADGGFDLAVNGGGPVATSSTKRAGYVTAQRAGRRAVAATTRPSRTS